jgi:hypothetical protein
LRLACDEGNVELAAVLIESGADNDGVLFAAEVNKHILRNWKTARTIVARDAQMTRSLGVANGDLLGDHLPDALTLIVQEYVFFSPFLDLDALLVDHDGSDDDAGDDDDGGEGDQWTVAMMMKKLGTGDGAKSPE